MNEAKREILGSIVRAAWIGYCETTGAIKPKNMIPWDELDDWNKEADRVIGETLFNFCLDQIVFDMTVGVDPNDDSVKAPDNVC